MEQTRGVRTIREFQVAAVIYITNVTDPTYLGYKSFESGIIFSQI